MNLNNHKLPVAVFASGNGTNFEAIAKADLPIEIEVLVCDHHEAPVIQRARKFQVPVFLSEAQKGVSKADRESKILQRLKEDGVKAIFLAGYMRIVGPTLLNAYPKRILNIHPALLPKFPGRHGIKDAYDADVPYTGVTIHYIDQKIDNGPVIAQEKVPHYTNDSLHDLAMRIHHTEHQLYPNTIRKLIQQGKL
ncbi:phosphoribosylglycinamide formyltransferase [Philodulcilactobacillus myokoensis]|uniref:Phosphoribosylglycinamide formyltransferase n=1 Tax=Philodulcilactobacillus myokoensis TaxID=2929573 RepID=A0A9W6B4L1_9LACO|nr:phosphoribosylglycinamide formyltransferase [Philodulcilactobacillus myokoensis]